MQTWVDSSSSITRTKSRCCIGWPGLWVQGTSSHFRSLFLRIRVPLIDYELRRLNEEIGGKEQVGAVSFFDELLADTFPFRCARGTIVDKRHYLDGLASFAENPYERLETVVENVTLDGGSGVVNVLVLAKRKNMGRAAVFKNVRVFSHEGEDWKLLMWVNTKIGDLL